MFDASIVYIYSDLPSYVRVNKTLPLLVELFREVHFIGSTRQKKLDSHHTKGVHYHITDLKLGSGLSTIPGVAQFNRYIRDQLKRIQPDVVMAVNEEYILPFVFGYLPRPGRLVLDLYDSIGMRIAGRCKVLNPIFRKLSEIAIQRWDLLVEVTEERLAWHRKQPPSSVVVHNSPPYSDSIIPYEGLPEKFVYVTGMLLDDLHGVETILEAVEFSSEFEIVFTGRCNGDFVENHFLKHPKVHNLGLVSPHEVLQIYAASSGVWCHYKPILLNYVYGAPNKLYEAMMLGKPVFINSENRISRMTARNGFGLLAKYGDSRKVAGQLEFLSSPASEKFAVSCDQAREVFREKYSWQIMSKRYEEAFQSLGLSRL